MKTLSILALLWMSVAGASPEKIQLALNWKAEPQFGGFYAALWSQEFQKRGLEVQILEGGSGTPTVQMLGAKQVDYAIVSAEEIALAHEHGSQIVALFATYQTNPQAIMTHAGEGFQSLKDVFNSNGTLAMQKGLSYAKFLLKKYPAAKVKIVPYLGGIGNFVADPHYSQQCFYTSEPLLAEKAGQKVKTFLVADEGFNPYTTVLAVSAERLKKDPAGVKAMVEAVRAGWSVYLKNPESFHQKMKDLNKAMDLKTMSDSATAQKKLIETPETQKQGLGSMSEERWKNLIQQMKDLGLLHKDLSARDLYRTL